MQGLFFFVMLIGYLNLKKKKKKGSSPCSILTYCPFFQMSTLFLMVLYGALCCASSNSNQDNIETLMDNGW